jgi:hypothetical protein
MSAIGTKQPFFAKALATQEGNNFQPTIAGRDSGTLAYRSRGARQHQVMTFVRQVRLRRMALVAALV